MSPWYTCDSGFHTGPLIEDGYHLLQPPGSIPGLRWVRRNQTKNNGLGFVLAEN